MNNYLPNGDDNNRVFSSYEVAFDRMLQICESVYQVDNWAEIAELAKRFDVKEF